MSNEQLAKLYKEANGNKEAFFDAVCKAGGSKMDASFYWWQQEQKSSN